jgi:hypothetical protein
MKTGYCAGMFLKCVIFWSNVDLVQGVLLWLPSYCNLLRDTSTSGAYGANSESDSGAGAVL